ncbi:MAG: carboxypeptidase regulatory-like domain-containing protein [Vulcanimicrobiaceae bacterium]
MRTARFWLALASALACAATRPSAAHAAEATTGTISGTVTAGGQTLANVRIDAASASGNASVRSDLHGRFIILGLTPDTYTVSAQATGYQSLSESGVLVLPGGTRSLDFRLIVALKTIGIVKATAKAFAIGSPSDSFTIAGANARAQTPPVSSSGLANYAAGTVQGAIAAVPGVQLDAFANAIVRGGQVDDSVFDYDSIPIPQALIAEPGGNVVGAQLPTTGIASTTVTLAGFESQSENALGGVIDQIPAVGTYPGSTTLELADGVAGAPTRLASFELLGATPDRRLRYAFASTVGSDGFTYGNGAFNPYEAGTYGLALQNRSQYSFEGNVHEKVGADDDVSILGLVGQAAYDQYGTPYAGETYGAFDGATIRYPGETDPNAPVDFATGIRGTYDLLKATWLHTGERSLSRVQLYQSRIGSSAGGPFWDENGFPNGAFSLSQYQAARETGLGYDGDLYGTRHHLSFGAGYSVDASYLNQLVPTFDEVVTSKPTLSSFLAYAGDTWSLSRRLDLMAAARLTSTHVLPDRGFGYSVGALDPHFAASYHLGDELALRATFDHTTVAPKPLEADRFDSNNVDQNGVPAPFVPLAPESANDFTYSLEGGGALQFRATYYADYEKNRIDVLPVNFRQEEAGGVANPIGLPTNIGQLRAHGFELWLHRGGLTFDADLIRAFSSSASQFAYNSLNAPAIAAGHLFPVGYVPDLTSTLSYELASRNRRLRVTPSLSFETGYPYGNGRKVWIFNPTTHAPEQVSNDNFVNPGANYYFLENPALPYNAATNPYIGNLGTDEGNDPNTLRTPPQTLVNLHVEDDIAPNATLILDVVNLFGNFSPTAFQGNPYLIGPPGYVGGNPLYGAAYQSVIGSSSPYLLGNGVPTNDGVTQSVPWSYGRGGYVPQSYPLGRTVQLRLRLRM